MLMHTSLARKPFRRPLYAWLSWLAAGRSARRLCQCSHRRRRDLPVYARISSAELYHTDDWAVIVFYPPASVRAGRVQPARYVRFRECVRLHTADDRRVHPLGTRDRGWRCAIAHSTSRPGAVPVWFVSWPELQTAVADGYLTVGELDGLPSHVAGFASHYQESLHVGGVSNVGKIEFTAAGVLEDGRSFQVEAMARDEVGRYMNVLITFR